MNDCHRCLPSVRSSGPRAGGKGASSSRLATTENAEAQSTRPPNGELASAFVRALEY